MAIAQTLTNTPFITGNFKLFVIQNIGNNTSNTDNWFSQIIISTNGFMSIRGFSEGTWHKWHNISASIDLSPYTTDWSNLNSGQFSITHPDGTDAVDSNLITKFPNVYQCGTLVVSNFGHNSMFYYQMYIPHKLDLGDQGLYLRTYYASINQWTDWECIHINDYSSKLFNTNGYIIFHNGLILQWKNYYKQIGNDHSEYSINPGTLINISMHYSKFFPSVVEGTGFTQFRLANGLFYIKPDSTTNMVATWIYSIGFKDNLLN